MKNFFKKFLKERRRGPELAFQRSGIERRKFVRVSTQNLVKTFSMTGSELTNLYDISEGGVRIRLTQSVPQGVAIESTVNLKEIETTASGLGEIVWVSRGQGAHHSVYHAGIRFTDISEENRDKIRNYVKQKSDSLDRRSA